MNAIELYNEGLMKAKEGAFDEAIELLEESLQRDPLHVNTYNVLGKLLIRKGALRKARKCWKTALTMDPPNRTALACLEASKRGKLLSRIGWSLAFAIALIGAVFAFKGANYHIQRLHTDLSTLISLLDERLSSPPGQTSTSAEQKPAEDPSQTSTPTSLRTKMLDSSGIKEVYSIAMQYHKNGKFDEAISQFKEILDFPSAHHLKDNAQYWIGESYYDKGDYKQALSEFKKVAALYPGGNKALDAQIKIAYCYHKLGEDEKALGLLTGLADDYPNKGPHAERAVRSLTRKIQSKSGNYPNL